VTGVRPCFMEIYRAMKNKLLTLTYLIVFTACSAICVFGQQPASAPFAELDNQIEKQHGWGLDKRRLAALFNIGRKRLGDRFEPELMKYLGQDQEKHYWISLFIEDRTYLQGATPLPHLALLIRQQALALLDGKEDRESLSNIVSLSVTAAVLSEQLGLHELATSHKVKAERLIQRNPVLAASFPAMYEEERKLYESLPPQNVSGAVEAQTTWKANGTAPDSSFAAPRPKKINVSSGVLHGMAIKNVQPAYPSEARAAGVSGVVKVQVLISEEGLVIEATAVEGPEQLREAAIEAARRWTFRPVELAGQAVKVSGVLSFNFALK
jgi:TonB family protein